MNNILAHWISAYLIAVVCLWSIFTSLEYVTKSCAASTELLRKELSGTKFTQLKNYLSSK